MEVTVRSGGKAHQEVHVTVGADLLSLVLAPGRMGAPTQWWATASASAFYGIWQLRRLFATREEHNGQIPGAHHRRFRSTPHGKRLYRMVPDRAAHPPRKGDLHIALPRRCLPSWRACVRRLSLTNKGIGRSPNAPTPGADPDQQLKGLGFNLGERPLLRYYAAPGNGRQMVEEVRPRRPTTRRTFLRKQRRSDQLDETVGAWSN